jgi:hypothetical protein
MPAVPKYLQTAADGRWENNLIARVCIKEKTADDIFVAWS